VKVLLTGADGFLGWHTRALLQALGSHEVVPVSRTSWADLNVLAAGVDAVIHCAGGNRESPGALEEMNIGLARDLAEAVKRCANPPRIVYANSIRSVEDTAYGRGKRLASELLLSAAVAAGGAYTDVHLPNLFGERCRPHYNSFVATFIDSIVKGYEPNILDSELALLHAQSAASALIAGLSGPGRVDPPGTIATVRGVFDTLVRFGKIYARGEIPAITVEFERDLFNSLRYALFPANLPIPMSAHSDVRGRLVEIVRSHGGDGQTFASTTNVGAIRGEHFHLHKIERFGVVSGSARIALREIYGDQVVAFDVCGGSPVAVDIPTMWAHNIANTGNEEITTLFWTHPMFESGGPDTYSELVEK